MEDLIAVKLDEEMKHPIELATVFDTSAQVPDVASWMARVSVLVPVYLNGNATLIVFDNQQVWYLPWSVATTYDRLALANLTTKSIIRRQYEREMGTNQNVPLICQRVDKILPAFKFRSPLVRTDGAAAYVNLADIVDCKVDSRHTCRMILNTGVDVYLQMRHCHVERRIRETRHFRRALHHPDTVMD